METKQGKWMTCQQVAGRWNVSVDTIKRLENRLTTKWIKIEERYREVIGK